MLHIVNDYYIDADEYSFSIVRRHVREKGEKKGQEYFRQISYHTNIRSCMNRLNDFLVRDSIVFNWSEKVATNAWQQLSDTISKLDSKWDWHIKKIS